MAFVASDYREFAGECLEAARTAKTDERRKHYLDMARMWTEAAAQLDDGDILRQLPETLRRLPG